MVHFYENLREMNRLNFQFTGSLRREKRPKGENKLQLKLLSIITLASCSITFALTNNQKMNSKIWASFSDLWMKVFTFENKSDICWKHIAFDHSASGFPTFAGGIEMVNWLKMGQLRRNFSYQNTLLVPVPASLSILES